MKVLYEVSNLGLGHVDSKIRTGIFRVSEALIEELLKNPDIDAKFTSCCDLSQACLTKQYFLAERPSLIEKTIDTWDLKLFFLKIYTKILQNVYSNRSGTLLTRIKRKILAIFLKILEFFAKENEITERFDIYHSFYFNLPSRDRLNVKARVITIYDLIPILMPHYFNRGNKENFQKIIHSINLEKDWVICISESTKRDFCKITGMPAERVFVTPLAASSKFYPQADRTRIGMTYKKYGIPPGRHILGLSTLEPRKNNAHLIKCFYKLISEYPLEDVYLVLVGAKGWLYDEIFQTIKSTSKLQNKVIFPGYIDDEDLSSIYSGATLFVYPSIYEGFGLPPLEAMQCGLPVITSNTSSLPEVVGDAGIMVDPKDEDALCQAMLALLNDPSLREHFIIKGLERSQQFSWSKCAAETVAIYKQIISY
jgi:glycosyltransferase involved in cell wall biosynthesis